MATQTKERTGGIVTAPTLARLGDVRPPDIPWDCIRRQTDQLQAGAQVILSEALATVLTGAQAEFEAAQARLRHLRLGRRFTA